MHLSPKTQLTFCQRDPNELECRIVVKSPVQLRADAGCAWSVGISIAFVLLILSTAARAINIEETEKQLIAGNYDRVISSIQSDLTDGAGGEQRHSLLSRALLAVGRYADALQDMTNALEQESQSF